MKLVYRPSGPNLTWWQQTVERFKFWTWYLRHGQRY